MLTYVNPARLSYKIIILVCRNVFEFLFFLVQIILKYINVKINLY